MPEYLIYYVISRIILFTIAKLIARNFTHEILEDLSWGLSLSLIPILGEIIFALVLLMGIFDFMQAVIFKLLDS